MMDVFAQSTWRRTYGGFGSDVATSIINVDSGFMIFGSTGSFGSDGDSYLLNIDNEGSLEWSRFYGGEGVDTGEEIQELIGVGFATIGTTQNSMNYIGYIEFLDELGGSILRKEYVSPNWEFFKGLTLADEFIYITGNSYFNNGSGPDIILYKIDMAGDTLWKRTYSTPYSDEAVDVIATVDGGCAVIGTIYQFDGTSDVIVIRYDEFGDIMWEQLISTNGSEVAYGGCLTSDGGFVVVGHTDGMSDHVQMLVGKVNVDGSFGWIRNVGDQPSEWIATNVQERTDGGLAISGYSNAVGWGGYDAYLLLTDWEGYYEFGTTFGEIDDDFAFDIRVLDDGFILVGETSSYGPGVKAIFAVRTGIDGLTATQQVIETFDPVSVPSHYRQPFNLYPNPVVSEGVLNISSPQQELVRSITLTDLSGRVIVQQDCFACTSFKLPSVSHGLYNLMVEIDGGVRSVHPIIIN